MKWRSDELRFRAGIILSATDFLLEVGCSFRESLGVANTGQADSDPREPSEMNSWQPVDAARWMRRNHMGHVFLGPQRILTFDSTPGEVSGRVCLLIL